jgi:cell division protease FtsH
MSLGHTEISPVADRAHETRSRLLQSITALLGGRAAEQLIFDEMTAGAASDIKIATRYARAMVVELGMSSLGPINFGDNTEVGDFGKLMNYEESDISPSTKEKIDLEVEKIINTAYKEATALVKKHRKTLDKLAQELLDKETLSRSEFEKLIVTKKPE